MTIKCSPLICRTVHWNTVCPGGEALHVARIHAQSSPHWRLHRHDFYECFLVEAGRVEHLLGNGSDTLSGGELVFVRPEHRHGFEAAAAGFSMVNLAFRADLAKAFLGRHPETAALWGKQDVPRKQSLPKPFLPELERLIDLVALGGRAGIDAEFALCLITRAAGRTAPSTAPGKVTGLPDWLRDALPAIEEPDVLRAGVAAIVRICGRGPEHVSRTFRRCLGATPTGWLNEARMRYARRLLETTSLPVLEVALECGFESPSQFHRLFRAATGTTPLRHRNQAQQITGFPARTTRSG